MKFLSDNLSDVLLDQCRLAEAVDIAVAYFSPDDEVLKALDAIPNLRVIVSGEFATNNPYKLESLKRASIHATSPISSQRLHAKVYLFYHKKGIVTALIGSANLTRSGLRSNKEVCIFLDSRSQSDQITIKAARKWFEQAFSQSREPDWQFAKQTFDDSSRPPGQRTTSPDPSSVSEPNYWIIKTRPGTMGIDYWENFKRERVVAIGWNIGKNPLKLSETNLLNRLLKDSYIDGNAWKAKIAQSSIIAFIRDLKEKDIVVVCTGYPPNQKRDISLYGVAEVIERTRYDKTSSWPWKLKCSVNYQFIEENVPVELVRKALNSGSKMRMIHSISSQDYENLRKALRHEMNIRLDY